MDTHNKQMVNVLKSLKTRGWEFETFKLNPKMVVDKDKIGWTGDTFWFANSFIGHRIPTIREAERVIDKMAHYWGFEKSFPATQAWNQADGYRYDADQHINGKRIHSHTYFDEPYTELKRLYSALIIADKLAEAEPDKFKEIWND